MAEKKTNKGLGLQETKGSFQIKGIINGIQFQLLNIFSFQRKTLGMHIGKKVSRISYMTDIAFTDLSEGFNPYTFYFTYRK